MIERNHELDFGLKSFAKSCLEHQIRVWKLDHYLSLWIRLRAEVNCPHPTSAEHPDYAVTTGCDLRTLY